MPAPARPVSPPRPPAAVAADGPPVPRSEVRQAVRAMLTQSKAFASLPPEKQQQIARDTALIADYLASPEGIPGNTLAGGVAATPARALEGEVTPPPGQASYQDARQAVSEIGDGKFEASAAREGAKVAGLLLKQVNFVDFVGGLIQGVFSSIVQSSIQQMEAYAKMVEQVAKSLQQFRDDNVTENQGRDHMVERFPDVFEIGMDDFAETPGPRLRLREGVDEDQALKQVRTSMKFEDGKLDSMDLSDENVEKALVIAARTQLARQRQQLLASLVIMGINRIVVTDGKISAKIMYDFQARDTRSLRRSAVASDYARDAQGNLAVTRAGEGEYDSGGDASYSRDRDDEGSSVNRDANWYAKGKYKYSEQPVMTAMSTASEASDSQLQTRAQLAGAVEVNFKSDYLPLEKMATPGMIAAIQGNSTPVDPNVVPSARNPAPASATTPAATPVPPA
jgi:hypothetical protein